MEIKYLQSVIEFSKVIGCNVTTEKIVSAYTRNTKLNLLILKCSIDISLKKHAEHSWINLMKMSKYYAKQYTTLLEKLRIFKHINDKKLQYKGVSFSQSDL